jgi:hypothetical protein
MINLLFMVFKEWVFSGNILKQSQLLINVLRNELAFCY